MLELHLIHPGRENPGGRPTPPTGAPARPEPTPEDHRVQYDQVQDDQVQNDHYQSAGPLFVRVAGAPRTHPLPPLTGTAPDVLALAADPLLREAVRVASGSLAESLDRLASGAGLPAKRLTGAALSLTRYALRHRGRPTPFGLFAGVAAARTGPSARLEIRGPGRKAVRPDGAWLAERVREWLEAPEVRRRVHVVVNDLCRVRGTRLILPAAPRDLSVRHTPLVAWVCDAATVPQPYDGLLEKAAVAFPEAPAERVDAALAQLIRHGFLLTSLDEPHLDGRTLDRVEAAVAPLPEAADRLRAVRDAVHAYERAVPGEGEDAWRRALRAAGADDGTTPPPFQVDLRTDADVRIPPAVVEEARRYASAMWAVSRKAAGFSHLREYCDAFLERYGMTARVPLGELVDPHRGLGFPAAYRERGDAAEPPAPEPRDAVDRARRRLVAELVQEALAGGDDEIVVDERVLGLLAADDDLSEAEREAAGPDSLELCFQLLADSAEALDRGEFALVQGPHSGSWTAGATAARFAELTGATDGLARFLGILDDGRTLPAQVVFRPHAARALNPLRVPRLLPHRIPVGVYADPAEEGHLDWRRLLVSVDASGMRLTDPATGRRVLPVVPHLVSPQRQAPKVARLLYDIGVAHSRVWTDWDWYGLQDLPFLPRVTFGRITVSPKRWLPDRHLRAAAADDAGWDAALDGWRRRYRVPERVQIVRGDQGFGVDLTDPWHRALLRREVRTGGGFGVVEDRTAGGRGLGWAHGHMTEVLIPLVHRPRPAAPAPAYAPVPAVPVEDDVRLPGEDWLYAKLYAGEDAHGELLGGCLPALLRDVDGHVDHWFFIRYRDPDPHLRVRFHGDPEALRSRVLPELARHVRTWREAGLLRGMSLEAYEPETERYGGPEALRLAERLFHLDSRSALAQTGRPRGAGLPDEVLAAANHAMLLESLGDWDWCSWVDAAFAKSSAHTAFQKHRALARRLIGPGRTAPALAGHLGVPGLAELWDRPPEARAYGGLVVPHDGNALFGLLHMQHNRLLGIDRDREERGYAVLRGIAREELGRRRAAGGGTRGHGAE
ncbi:lantibiotic dehydratase [Streptomyces sp. URMC 126]|uniref:lantibiotic dehydratase n=1 Tax=Streptomyces sp. URMC 126 TaxID=3423401 RepID=UPI003F1E45A9